MAPRRLVLVMIFLLAVSTVVAIIAPNPSERTESGSGTTPGQDQTRESGERTTPDPADDEVERASGPGPQARTVTVMTGGRIEVIPVEPDLRVVLEVRSARTAEIAIPELGRTAIADRWAPAVFDLVTPEERGSLTIEDLSGREPVARLVIR